MKLKSAQRFNPGPCAAHINSSCGLSSCKRKNIELLQVLGASANVSFMSRYLTEGPKHFQSLRADTPDMVLLVERGSRHWCSEKGDCCSA